MYLPSLFGPVYLVSHTVTVYLMPDLRLNVALELGGESKFQIASGSWIISDKVFLFLPFEGTISEHVCKSQISVLYLLSCHVGALLKHFLLLYSSRDDALSSSQAMVLFSCSPFKSFHAFPCNRVPLDRREPRRNTGWNPTLSAKTLNPPPSIVTVHVNVYNSFGERK